MTTIQLKEVNDKEAILTLKIDLKDWKQLSKTWISHQKLNADLILETIEDLISDSYI